MSKASEIERLEQMASLAFRLGFVEDAIRHMDEKRRIEESMRFGYEEDS